MLFTHRPIGVGSRWLSALPLTLALLCACVGPTAQAASLCGRVSDVSHVPMATSGVVPAWIRISVIEDDKRGPMQLFLAYLEPKQEIPRIGERCTFEVHHGDVNGYAGSEFVNLRGMMIVESFHCDR